MSLSDNERQALAFLAQGPDTPGVVDSMEVMSAHFVYLDLVERGLVEKRIGEDGPVYSISPAGTAALAAPVLH